MCRMKLSAIHFNHYVEMFPSGGLTKQMVWVNGLIFQFLITVSARGLIWVHMIFDIFVFKTIWAQHKGWGQKAIASLNMCILRCVEIFIELLASYLYLRNSKDFANFEYHKPAIRDRNVKIYSWNKCRGRFSDSRRKRLSNPTSVINCAYSEAGDNTCIQYWIIILDKIRR